ncbi:hypothetical protein GBK02_10190 [Dechloromonas sp. TW-R-39-2]|uniref:hypothetical protein n=1 Tax=Dechloromonas sp. TW-R-39-2 TaxID=2654218 RepID=UPI00193D1C40|nr:hypothetical protein [Dechloromonas sp. TW-R-39-2]QRM19748.1 hypothetical protein GBK02_10190 [Dechloromonas sp. TW-R-39-2]
MNTDSPAQAPNCMRCRHHLITYDTHFPYACQALGFRSRRQPSRDVLENSGMICQWFEPRQARP